MRGIVANMTRLGALLLVAPVALLSGACGLISSDVDNFVLELPEWRFTVDMAMSGIAGSGQMPDLNCPPVDCAAQNGTFCPDGACEVVCGEDTKCRVAAAISLYRMVNLANEKPELASLDGRSGVSVGIDEISFLIEVNTLSMDLPPLQIYIGPTTSLEPGQDGVVPVGTIAATAQGTVGERPIEFTAEGRMLFDETLSNYTIPFHLIVGTTFEVVSGQDLPRGQLAGKVVGTAHADAI